MTEIDKRFDYRTLDAEIREAAMVRKEGVAVWLRQD